MSEDKKSNCHYDYAKKCDCSDDDNCGCTYPNNMAHDFDDIPDKKENSNGSSPDKKSKNN